MTQFVDIFNLVSCYRRYEASIEDRFGDKDSGPGFLVDWVRRYPLEKGIVKFTPEMLNRKMSECFEIFARDNPAIKGLVFDDAL